MNISDRRNIILRLALLGVFTWIGLSAASASSFKKIIDTRSQVHLDVSAGQTFHDAISFVNQGSASGAFKIPLLPSEAAFCSARLRLVHILAGLRLQGCRQTYLAIRGIILQINTNSINPVQEDTTSLSRIS